MDIWSSSLVFWFSLGLVAGCRQDGTVSRSGMSVRPANQALTERSKPGPATADGWEPGPAEAWRECARALGIEHKGVNGQKLVDFELLLGPWISKGNASIVSVRAERGALVGELLSPGGEKTLLQGDAWKGVELRGRFRCPAKSTLILNVQARIRDVIPEGGGAGTAGDAWRYNLEILWPPAGSSAQSWMSDHTPGYAVAFEGVWDDRTGEHRSSDDMLTLPGDDTAVGKCSQHFHYRPWDTGDPASPKPMSELHAACVRMVRADYCGDGTSSTKQDTDVDVWDTANVNTKSPDRSGLRFEAAWTSKGAICLDHPRHPSLATPCASTLPVCRSPEEAKALARQKGLGDVLLFNASYKGRP